MQGTFRSGLGKPLVVLDGRQPWLGIPNLMLQNKRHSPASCQLFLGVNSSAVSQAAIHPSIVLCGAVSNPDLNLNLKISSCSG